MARTPNGTDSYCYANSRSGYGLPLTISIWVKINDDTATGRVFGIYSDDLNFINALTIQYWGTPKNFLFYQVIDGVAEYVQIPVTVSAGVWYHLGAVAASTTSRYMMLDGANKTSNTNSLAAPNSLDSGLIIGGAQYSDFTNAYNEFLPCDLAEAATWNTALGDSELVSLSKSFSPKFIRPSSALDHWPLMGRTSPEPSLRSASSLTLVNTVNQASHPKLILPTEAVYG